MENFDKKAHWENVYTTKQITEVSWYQIKPETSLQLIENCKVPKSAKIIDVGGGDGFLVDYLLELGYTNITVLDISETAIEKAKKRLGKTADLVNWIVADAANFNPTETYDVWHDRAAFHFLTNETEIENYKNTVQNNLNTNGFLIIGTFSEQGPTKCSGINIKQYNEKSLYNIFRSHFKQLSSFTINHETPFNTIQNFVFSTFQKL